jgi:uncharacterized membrane protein
VKFKDLNLKKIYPYILVICGTIGLVASLVLSHDTLAVAQNSHYVPSCNLNPIISCGNVINAPGDKILGLPYPYYGIGVFAVLIGSGAGILAGAKYKKWYWLTFQTMMTLGTIGAYFLLLKSIFKIHSLCPFCLSVDVATNILFWYTSLYVIDTGIIVIKNKKFKNIYNWARKHHLDLLILWFVIVIAFILNHFWYYYGQHIHF